MLPWKPFLAVVPAGLLLGLVAGQATRPVMLVKDDRPWPYAADETAREADRRPTFDLSTPAIASRGAIRSIAGSTRAFSIRSCTRFSA